jgi:hypothetical protein
MIRLADIVARYAPELLERHGHSLLPGQLKALTDFGLCRGAGAPKMQLSCDGCDESVWLPHSCGNRHCPHCQAHESQRWIDKQLQKLVPGEYFMVTFTLPSEFRKLAWNHQRELYELVIRNAWDTVNTFSHNDKKLRGAAGAVAVLHTHNRQLDFHPHVHLIIPAVAFDAERRLWRSKSGGYLFDHTALAIVFRAKMLDGIRRAGLKLPARHPAEWVVDCKAVGAGGQALVYLGRYLYRGVLPEKNIVSDQDGKVTFLYRDSKTKKWVTRALNGVEFLGKILLHILPKGFRRARNFGFLHHNSKLVQLVQLIKRVFVPPPKARPVPACPCCGKPLRVVRTRVKNPHRPPLTAFAQEMAM